MSHHVDQTFLSPKIEKGRDDHHSKFKDIIVLNNNQPPKGKDLDNRPHFQAPTRVREDGPSRWKTSALPTNSCRITCGDDIKLVELLLKQNKRLREAIIDLINDSLQAQPTMRTMSLSPDTLQEGVTEPKLTHLHSPKKGKKGRETTNMTSERNP